MYRFQCIPLHYCLKSHLVFPHPCKILCNVRSPGDTQTRHLLHSCLRDCLLACSLSHTHRNSVHQAFLVYFIAWLKSTISVLFVLFLVSSGIEKPLLPEMLIHQLMDLNLRNLLGNGLAPWATSREICFRVITRSFIIPIISLRHADKPSNKNVLIP